MATWPRFFLLCLMLAGTLSAAVGFRAPYPCLCEARVSPGEVYHEQGPVCALYERRWVQPFETRMPDVPAHCNHTLTIPFRLGWETLARGHFTSLASANLWTAFWLHSIGFMMMGSLVFALGVGVLVLWYLAPFSRAGSIFVLVMLWLGSCPFFCIGLFWLGDIERHETQQFREHLGIGPNARIDRAVIDLFEPGLAREEVHRLIREELGEIAHANQNESSWSEEWYEIVTIKTGRYSSRKYVFFYDVTDRLLHVTSAND